MTTLTASAPPNFKRLRQVANIASWTLLVGLFVAIAGFAVVVRTGHVKLNPILSGSMRPHIHPGDVVLTHAVPVSSLHVGDIVSFRPPGQKLERMHRIASLKADGPNTVIVTTKGDANNAADPWGQIKMRGTAYRAGAVIPKIGWLVNGGLRWITLALTVIGAIIIARMTWKYVRS